jgi:hypothetical protein
LSNGSYCGAARAALDGRNRYRACGAAGIEPRPFFCFDDQDETALAEFVLSKSLHRRQLTASQQAMIVAEALNIRQYKHGGDRRLQDWKGKAEDQDRPGGLEKTQDDRAYRPCRWRSLTCAAPRGAARSQ